MKEFELIAKTFMGLEPVLAKELTQLGANDIQIGRRMVSFTGNKELMYRANFQLRTAIRILKPIKHFKAKSADDVYDEIKKIDPNSRIIMCSAMGQQAMVIEAIQSGAKDFIVKPFQAERVLEAVKKVVG